MIYLKASRRVYLFEFSRRRILWPWLIKPPGLSGKFGSISRCSVPRIANQLLYVMEFTGLRTCLPLFPDPLGTKRLYHIWHERMASVCLSHDLQVPGPHISELASARKDGGDDELIIINVLWVQTFDRSEKSLGSALAVLAVEYHFADANLKSCVENSSREVKPRFMSWWFFFFPSYKSIC